MEQKQFRINVTDDIMAAKILFFTTDSISYDAVESELAAERITYGIDEKELKKLVEQHEAETGYVIAEGKEAIYTKPGKINYLFKTSKDFEPEIDEQGNVNYHNLNIIAKVKQDQLIVSLTPNVEGEDGFNIRGERIPCGKAKPLRIYGGKNTYLNDTKDELYASKNGLIQVVDGRKVIVQDVYEVISNVANSTGDIEFDGSVVIRGNVMTGFSVIAKGDVEVYGVVEGAYIKAEGDVILHRGIQGKGRGKIEVGGDLRSKYIEQAEVHVEGEIHAEAIMHSQVSCKQSVVVEGKKGMIAGGRVRAGVSVATKILGSHMGTSTLVDVGIDPVVVERYNYLKKELPKVVNEEEQLEKVVLLLNKRKELEGKLDDEKQKMYLAAVRNKVVLNNKVQKYRKEYECLVGDLEHRYEGSIRVSEVLYPGVKVTIGNIQQVIREEIKYVVLTKKGADISISSL